MNTSTNWPHTKRSWQRLAAAIGDTPKRLLFAALWELLLIVLVLWALFERRLDVAAILMLVHTSTRLSRIESRIGLRSYDKGYLDGLNFARNLLERKS